MSAPARVDLRALSEDERQDRFERLQARLPDVWRAMRVNRAGESLVVVPSILPSASSTAAAMRTYEERLLFLLLLLRQPRLQMIYVTSTPVEETVVDYYLSLLSGVIPSHARRRLQLVPAYDGTARPLTEKLLERPRLIERIRALIPDPALCHLVPYSTTTLERDLAVTLGIPMYGADPRLFRFGTKSGCRRLFSETGVEHPFGSEDLHDLDDVVAALAKLRATRPSCASALVKLNEGVSGKGNAVVDLAGLPPAGGSDEHAALASRVRSMTLEHAPTGVDAYLAALHAGGGIVEERITGAEIHSPSVQLRVTPLGEVELLSTHDQLLGGPSGQSYVGCRFPAAFGYARKISREARRIAEYLAREGVLGRFAVDFVVARDHTGRGEEWRAYAIELNLRKGGTTHPFLTLQFLTGGVYDPDTALFTAPSGREKHMVATDHLESDALRGLTHDDLFDIVARHGLHFDQARQTGVIFHMMSGLSELGSVGLTAVADTAEQAETTYRRAERILLDEAGLALTAPVLPAV